MSKEQLCAGAGRAVVEIGADILPVEGFSSVQNDLHVRVLILESVVRTVIVSLEITQIPDAVRLQLLPEICDICASRPEHVWITTTHSFAGPHLFPPGGPKGGKPRTPEDIERGERLLDSYVGAVRLACRRASQAMRPARVGWARGESAVIAGRSVLTRDGWWLGTDSEQSCDRTVSLLRVDSLEGEPLAALFVYGVRSGVMYRVEEADGSSPISSDLCGGACEFAEKAMGGAFTALFLCGGACDQEPVLKGVSNEVDKDGVLYETAVDRQTAKALLEAQSARLGADVLRVWGRAGAPHCAPEIRMGSGSVVCRTKVSADTRQLKPVRQMSFEPSGEQELEVFGLRIGGFMLAGVQPEMGGVTSRQIRQAFPDHTAAMAVMVNGNGKCMPDENAYRLFQYQSLNTPFMPGQAEIVRDRAVELLKDLM